MSKRFTLEDISKLLGAKAQGEVATQLYPAGGNVVPATIEVTRKPRLRQQRSGGLNKTERAFEAYLKTIWAAPVLPQSVTLKLANGVRYTPDFVVFHRTSGMHAYEVKGFMRDDAAVKLKVAAHAYPWITFYLVSKHSVPGCWNVERVLT
jgi:hypothetical protein